MFVKILLNLRSEKLFLKMCANARVRNYARWFKGCVKKSITTNQYY